MRRDQPNPRSRRLRVLWALVVALPVLGLTGEVLCALRQALLERRADEFRLRNPNVFAGTGARLAEANRLWKTPLFEYRPGAHLDLTVSGNRFVVDINSRGFRTREFSERKPARTIRVICIGGSTTVAGKTNDTTYPALLGKALQGTYPGYDVEVLNFGISGAQSDLWLKRSNELFRYEPDVVVQYEGINDIVGALVRYARAHPGRRKLYRSLLLQYLLPTRPAELDSYFLESIEQQVRIAKLCRKYHARHVSGSFAAPDYAAASKGMQAALDLNVTEWTAGDGMPLSQYRSYADLLQSYDHLFEGVAETNGLSVVPVKRTLTDPRLFVDLCHMNQDGITRLAEAFRPAVDAAITDGLRSGTVNLRYEDLPPLIELGTIDDRNLSGSWSPRRHPRGDQSFRWAMPPVSCVLLPVADTSKDVQFVVTARAPKRCQPQSMDLLANGHSVASTSVPIDWKDFTFVVPAATLVPGENTVCFRFGKAEAGEQDEAVSAAVATIRIR